MAVRRIEMMGSRVLREEAAPVQEIDAELRRLVRDLLDTMYDAGGIGLAAPQVGVSRRVLVVDVPSEEGTGAAPQVHTLVNPVVADSSAQTERESEGCLSIPGIEESVTRPARVTVEALAPDGRPVRIEADRLLARVLQHEIDHLDGVLFVDRLSPFKRRLVLKKWRKSRQG